MNLQEYRQAKGKSQTWLADRVHTSQDVISHYENGKIKPRYSFWFLLSYLFKTTPQKLSEEIEEFTFDKCK